MNVEANPLLRMVWQQNFLSRRKDKPRKLLDADKALAEDFKTRFMRRAAYHRRPLQMLKILMMLVRKLEDGALSSGFIADVAHLRKMGFSHT